jgi:hypothetical protein
LLLEENIHLHDLKPVLTHEPKYFFQMSIALQTSALLPLLSLLPVDFATSFTGKKEKGKGSQHAGIS